VDRYAEQVEQTASTLANRVGVSRSGWEVVFQSRSGPAEDWRGPDILDVVSGLPARGTRAVIAAPVQFCADHLEVLFDLDVATRERAEAVGLRYLRPASLNTAPGFIDALADVVRTTVEFAS
jgi:ferrochelatase